ncbi:MAG TPA: ankyrin repeat domain-containing protein [Campylobacterales bacterium]|nr:ankyrin repeat domain-containing protein [Campylobacterales bacterium]
MKKLLDLVKENNFLGLKQLIKTGIDLNSKIDTEDGENIFFLALRYRADLDILKLLIDNKLDLNYVNDYGVGILDEAVSSGNLDLVKYLIDEQNLDPKQTKRKSAFTPLMQASSYGYIEIIKYFVDYGVDISQRDSDGLTAKDYARKLGQKRVVNYFNSLDNL